MSAATSAQVPFLPSVPVMEAQQPAGTTVVGPLMLQDVMKLPSLALQLPQNLPEQICLGMSGPDRCLHALIHHFDVPRDCKVTVGHCKDSSDDSASENSGDWENDNESSGNGGDSVPVDLDLRTISVDDDDLLALATGGGGSSVTNGADEDNILPTSVVGLNQPRALVTGIPISVQNALLNDKNAPRSLAEEFSHNKFPHWYNKLPKEERQMFLSGRTRKPTPPPRSHDAACVHDDRDAKAVYRAEAKVASLYSKVAAEESKLAASLACPTRAHEANRISAKASSLSAEASLGLKALKVKSSHGKKNDASTMASLPKSSAIYAVSVTLATACLGLALLL